MAPRKRPSTIPAGALRAVLEDLAARAYLPGTGAVAMALADLDHATAEELDLEPVLDAKVHAKAERHLEALLEEEAAVAALEAEDAEQGDDAGDDTAQDDAP